MKKSKLKRLLALFLCMLMLIPSQGMTALAEAAGAVEGTEEIEETERISETLPLEIIEGAEEETERISETLPLELIEGAEDETARIKETLALETIKKNTAGEGFIYWNPGGVLPAELATASNAQAAAADAQTATVSNARVATASNAKKGNDNADGQTPSTPVKTLAKALERAEELMEEEGLLPTEITIYAMNPMEIADGQLYALNGGNLTIKSWPGRSYDSDVIFYVNGGQLTMMNARLASGNPERDEEEARLIYVRGGALQMGQNVLLEGRIVLDYRSETEEKEWAMATASDAEAGKATGSNAAASAGSDAAVSFDLDEYILNSDEESMELIEDRVSASTWRAPIIELLEGFDGGAGEYILELLADGSAREIELVKTLYSDAETEEDFLSLFTLVANTDIYWRMQVETQEAAQVRNTSLLRTLSVAEVLTTKTLVVRALDTKVYWNPGGIITASGTNYPAGDDDGYSGSNAANPVKTWERAVELAQGGMIICMQTLELGTDTGNYLQARDAEGNYLLCSFSTANRVSLSAWSVKPQPVISVPAGQTLALQDIQLVGVEGTSAQAIVCEEGGDIIINENVTAQTGYIQITAFKGMEEHPVKVRSTDTGMITLFFSGINDSYEYCYTDVVVPYGELADSITAAELLGEAEGQAKAEEVGQKLLNCFQLHSSHSDGTSKFEWILRQDTNEDDGKAEPQKLELYAGYYFDALYLNGVDGDDNYYGATCQYPVKTWAEAQERWASEMQRSVDARWKAKGAGQSAAYIAENYPLPKTIYICGTVTVGKFEEWDLWAAYRDRNPDHAVDYDESPLVVEVVSHIEVGNHDIPMTMVNVTSGGDLQINAVTFRNIAETTSNAESVTILVETDGVLTLKGDTHLTGERLEQGSVTYKEVTLGTHVKVVDGGTFVMDASWKGSIKNSQHGVKASGAGTKVTMDNGSIQENNAFELTKYNSRQTNHDPGAGVWLSDQAVFTMNGGKITENTVYQYGAGVYVEDEGTSFFMKAGEISNNKMAVNRSTSSSSVPPRGAGIGIYAGEKTILEIGDASAQSSVAFITGNTGYLADGAGIWCDSAFTINRAAISGNSIGNYYTGYYLPSYGIGISVGTNGELTMEDTEIEDNCSTTTRGDAFGAGIYFASSANEHFIKNSMISGNKVNAEAYSDYNVVDMSRGGGIYIAGGKLKIEGSEISDNEACLGGGICSYAASITYRAEIEIKKTIITENKARGYRNSSFGSGGGIYQYYYSSISLKDGVEITNNTASASATDSSASEQRGYGGGGIYICGYNTSYTSLVMEGDASGGILINGNESLSGYGGGIYQYNSIVSVSNAEIDENKATSGGGIYLKSGTLNVSNAEVDKNEATSGGGIYQYGGVLNASNMEVDKNKATSGGGIYAGAGTGYFRAVRIGHKNDDDQEKGNQATGSGGGLYLAGAVYYMDDCVVAGNSALGSGGGVYLGSSTLYLTGDDFILSENDADNGGGIYAAGGAFYMKIAGEIRNSAKTQGSNLYLGLAYAYILEGNFEQPKDPVPGTYNIYVNNTGTSAKRYFDMSKVVAEKKDTPGAPEVIYLNNVNSYLTYLDSPPDQPDDAFPIDLNEKEFKVGSVVVKPVNSTNIYMCKPKAELNGYELDTINYTLTDAMINKNYFSGGKLPRRTRLGGFADSITPSLTNVTLVGEGVYLDGQNGNDISGDGTSPETAVKTFKRAKELLEEYIYLYEQDAEGFTPFIYICGQVDIKSDDSADDKTWKLDYGDDLFLKTNENYIRTEEANNDTAYPAQVRRFASFISAPMIKVGTGSDSVEFSTEKIIINGMAEAVIVTDQAAKSPVIHGSAGTTVTLNEKSQITNNSYSGLDIYGHLLLKGKADDPDDPDINNYNKQIYNHHGSFVQLYGTMSMEDEARIYADDTTEKVGTLIAFGILVMAVDTEITMSGDSAIVHDGGNLLSYGIRTLQNNSSIKMSENASIQNHKSFMECGIYIAGTGSSLNMGGTANISADSASILYGIYALGTGTKVTMSKESKIVQSGTRTVDNYGIYQGGTDVTITMQDDALIACTYAGIWIGASTRPKVEMKGNAQIFNDNTLQTTYGIYIYSGANSSILSPTIEMTESASIHGTGTKKMNYAIYAATYHTSYPVSGLTVKMNMNEGADEKDCAMLTNCTTGYGLSYVNGASLSMGKEASITACTNGYYQAAYISSSAFSLLMQDDSRIANNAYGMNFTYPIVPAVNITLKGHAAIEANTSYGIYENPSSGYGLAKLDLQMSGYSRISGNSQNGIYLGGNLAFSTNSGYYHKITLNDEAVIGGKYHWVSGDGDSGNRYVGIYATSPIQLTMNDKSQISRNGSVYDYTTTSYTNGVYLTRTTGTNYRSGTANITLNDTASICDNKGGIYVPTISNTSYPTHLNTCVIELNGIKEDETGVEILTSPSIRNNTDAVFLGSQGTLRLKGEAILGETTYTTASYAARSLDCYGYLELDGRSTVEGLLYMRDGNKPITMTHAVPESDPLEKYKLHMAEGFLGQIVVQPENPGGDPADGMTDVTGQINYFKKISAEGMAENQPIIAKFPNLVLMGENNVYLSGSGSDSNNGNSKSTPVKTFKRAKQLLEGGENGGYFERGANIIICTTTVIVAAGDGTWSFDSGGYVTNEDSGHTWKPLVIRDEAFKGILITLSDTINTSLYPSTVTFKDITIDGGSEQDIVLTTAADDQLLYVGTNKTAILGEGAVLQNNKAVTASFASSSGVGIKVNCGTLRIDGGTIRNMVRETTTTYNNYGIASAIACYSNSSSYPAKIIMNSGQIVDNELNYPNASTTNARLGTIYLSDQYCSMEMNGGLISNNKVVTQAATPGAAGALVINAGSATMNGGIIRGNAGGYGSAIYYNGGSASNLILSGGQISGHTTNASASGGSASEAYSPIYIAGYGMQLKGGAADIQDPIYLASTNGVIKVSGQINQANRSYRVYLNQGTTSTSTTFKKGSVVVQPDGVYVTDVTPYLSYFDVRTNPYVLDQGRVDAAAGVNQSAVVPAAIKENQCLILMKAVYLDSVGDNSNDSNNGLTPATAVRTFSRAKTVGGASESYGTTDSYKHYIIYVCGTAVNTAAETTWELPEFAYMCRYTGFAVYTGSSGTATTEANRAHYGSLIEPAANLKLNNIAIYGRRTVDTAAISNGGSLVHINSGIEVDVSSGTILADNHHSGNYTGEHGQENLTSQGGAIHVAAGGTLRMDDGVIQNTEATYGSAIYLGASAAGLGRLKLTGSPEVSGKVYLDGIGDTIAAYIEPDQYYQPSKVLQLSIGNDHNGRPVIQYPQGVTPGAAELKYYLFDDAIKAMYDVVNRAGSGYIFELNMREVIYLDGQNGDDGNDGTSPAQAFRTLEKVYTSIGTDQDKYGNVVFVVDTVEVSNADIELMNIQVQVINGNNHYEGHYLNKATNEKIPVWGQVYFKRYAQPEVYQTDPGSYSDFSAPTLKETLVDVKEGGTLTLKGIYLDGHSQNSNNSNPTLVADGVTAMSPLVTVGKGGVLKCLLALASEAEGDAVATATLFTNNINENDKADREDEAEVKKIGKLNDSDIVEGSSAGIELLDGGECHLEYTEFSNLQLEGDFIVGGTDVYSNGDLHVSLYTHFTGTVYLEGLAAAVSGAAEKETSRFITVDIYGDPVKTNFQVLMRDPYVGRTVVSYPPQVGGIDAEPADLDIPFYRLEDRVKDYFCLNKRSDARYIFELEVPVAVYIDGIAGIDRTSLTDPVGRAVGSTPEYPVKSLKKAFELLKTRGGNTIYVVNTVQISANTEVTGRTYVGTDGTVGLESTDKVKITRYIQPDFAYNADPADAEAAGYGKTDFTGVLLNVTSGATAIFGSGVYFDGHSEPKINTDKNEYADGAIVNRNGEAKAPLITVVSGSTLTLSEGTTLLENNNTYADTDSAGQNGGAIANNGTVNVNGALFKNNIAEKGAVVYQNGTFTIQNKPENLSNHDNAFYLTTSSGTDHVIRTAVAIPERMVFDVDMDNAVKGRKVVQFTDSSAYSPYTSVDAEHEHFKLGSSVKPELFLVESKDFPEEFLELQNWERLEVGIPTNIYLAMTRKGSNDASIMLRGIKDDAPADALFTAPVYTITNNGDYAAKVSISGFKNQTGDSDVAINTDLYPLMNLTDSESEAEAVGSTKLYLAVKGLDTLDHDGRGFGMPETSLRPYEEEPENTDPAVLGTLTAKTTGDFTFIGVAGSGFMSVYMDPDFPIGMAAGEEAQKYMDGTSSTGKINARAKYLLCYKVEIDPSRRESSAASGGKTP